MNSRPNFGLSNGAKAGAFALHGPAEGVRVPSKPFDGFKTTQNTSKKPFEFRSGKSSNTDYRQPIGHAAMEKNLMKDIDDLDWELDSLSKPKPNIGLQSEANLKPKLFMKKKNFNDTGETKATVGALGDEWDISGTIKPRAKLAVVAKEPSAEASEWNLGGFNPGTSKFKAIKADRR